MEVLVQITINSLIASATYVLIALSFNFIYSVSRFFNLAHGSLVIVGGYGVILFNKFWGLDIVLAVILSLLLTGALGYFLEKVIYSPLRQRKGSNMVLLVASLGAMTMIQGLLQIFFGSQFRSLRDPSTYSVTYNFYGGVISQTQIIMIVLSVLVTAGLIFLVKKTLFGKAVKAIADDEEVAKIVGINTSKIVGYVFFIGSVIAALAGILIGFDTGVEPFSGLHFLLRGIIAAIIGGVGSLSGAFFGSLLLGFVENFGIWNLSAEWKDAIAFLLLIIFLIFRPKGIMNK